MLVLFCSLQLMVAQEADGVLPLDLPVRNSMTLNRYLVNPTFSFVREQNKFITISNKRELLQLEDAPQTYMASFSGRLQENIGIGVGAFQQDFGVLTAFGGIVNFAYNAMLQRESNLTFGVNMGAYKSGVNQGRVISNQADPSLNNIPSNFLLTFNPGINYGTGFMDFGVSVNNLVVYNVSNSTVLEENPMQGIQGHIMYTGYMDSYGFFQDSKFSVLGQTEFRPDNTIFSGSLMLTVPKGIWTQAGYNTLYGAFAGLGVNLTKQIAIEYNFEKPLGDFSTLGVSHEISLAYRFANNDYFDYSREEEMAGLISFDKKRKQITRRNKPKAASEAEKDALAASRADRQAENAAEKQAWEAAKAERERKEAEEQAKKEEGSKLDIEVEAVEAEKEKAQQQAEEQARREAQEQARLEAEERAREEAIIQARLAAEQKAKEEAEEQARIEAEEQARLEAEERARQEAIIQAQLAAEQKAKEEAEEQARIEAEEQARREAEEQARLEAEERARQEAIIQAQLAAEQKAKEEAEKQARIEAKEQARREAEAAAALENSGKEKDQLVIYTDPLALSMRALLEETENAEENKNDLLQQLRDAVAVKDQDLKDLKKENDLSEQGIFSEPKPFKSVTEENNRINTIKINLDEVILSYRNKIEELEKLYQQRVAEEGGVNDEFNLYYQNTLRELQSELDAAQREKAQLVSTLEEIAVATEFERKRRIKRAAFNNEEDRYQQDRISLNVIKQSTEIATTPLTVDDFNFGEAQKSNNVQILKNVANTQNGYYLVMAVHNSAEARDDFLRKVIAAGYNNVDFFYDVSRSKYYIYYKTFETINEANNVLENENNKPFTQEMSLYKIEN